MSMRNMQPTWKADTYCVPLPDGVYLRGNNNRLILKGKSLYLLLQQLIPHLDSKVTLGEITEGLDADRKRMVTNLIEKLFTHHFLTDSSQDQPHTLPLLEQESYASNIAFIESFQTSATHRFEAFRDKHFLFVGDGLACVSLIHASRQCGIKNVSVITTSEEERFRQEMLNLFMSDASAEDMQVIDPLSWANEAEVRHTIQAYDAILHIAQSPMLARAQLLNRLCIEEGKTLLQAITVDDHAWIGPLVCPETDACWECAWRRLQANLADADQPAHYEFRDLPLPSSSQPAVAQGSSILANRLLFDVFRHFTQAGPTETGGKISALHTQTSLSESHTFLPHPHCQACRHTTAQTASQFLEQMHSVQQQEPVDLDHFLEKFAHCVDACVGLFTAVENSHFVRLPLAVSKVKISHLLSREDHPETLSVVAASIDTRGARTRVAQKACERYAANCVDQRRLLSFEAVQQAALPTIASEQLLALKASSSESEMWTWALDLQTQQAALVPAISVFSSSCEHERGIGSGMTWEEAICQALLDWCCYLTVARLKTAQQPYPQIDLERACSTPTGAYLYRQLKAAGEQITAYDITGRLGVPTFAVCAGEKAVAYSTHCDSALALNRGLEQALQQYQATHFQQPAYALSPVPDFAVNLRGDQMLVPDYALPGAWQARNEWLLQQLQKNDLQAFVVPLDHDSALTQVLPYIVRVLLSGKASQEGR
ncbi:TOMM precursor leader peptide-binding protein [Ktedonobacter racemifer]|uniref:YcaO domain-containing protein n=1 Tax=Ktedonobacter racemifer DSM 44963 TaxID=485913 RepID=D6TFI3_KTERA|nr:TOMM precursor leader peptide-binding protein [Ktedonobacter racemifer]EFH88663.1 protein of unknown function DUF181 [Ktedonobacter racemifer DSM 44963]